jgi:hypothetical protein
MSHRITLNDHPIKHRFNFENNDLHLKHQGGWISSLLTSLIPVGVDLLTKLFKGNGLSAGAISETPIVLKVYKGKQMVHECNISNIGGAILSNKDLIKSIHNHKAILGDMINNFEGTGLSAGTLLSINNTNASGLHAGAVGGMENINED